MVTSPPGSGAASRVERLRAWAAAADVDRVDVVFGLGLLLVFVGLWLGVGAWLGGVAGLGVALTVVGVALVGLALLGLRAPVVPVDESGGG